MQVVARKSTPGKLAKVDLDELIDRIANGEFPSTIAREHGVSKVALHYKLREHPQYQQALEHGTDLLLERGYEQIQGAGDDLNLARIREIQLRRLEWRAERLFPHRWGQRTHVTVEQVGDLAEKLRRSKERVIEGEAQVVQALPAVCERSNNQDNAA